MLNARSRADLRCWDGSRDGGGWWVAHCVRMGHPGPASPGPRRGSPRCPGQPCSFAQVLSSLPPGNRNVSREGEENSHVMHRRLRAATGPWRSPASRSSDQTLPERRSVCREGTKADPVTFPDSMYTGLALFCSLGSCWCRFPHCTPLLGGEIQP